VPTTLNRDGYAKLVEENLAWLLAQPRSLERDHIADVLRDSPRVYYDLPLSYLARRDRVAPDPDGAEVIIAERYRQITLEGFDEEHDAAHGPAGRRTGGGALAWAAACYAAPERIYRLVQHPPPGQILLDDPWPADWDARWDKRPRRAGGPVDNSIMHVNKVQRVYQLKYAGALCAAEIDRIVRRSHVDTRAVIAGGFPIDEGTRDMLWAHLTKGADRA
jgi:hypothetical protein